MYAVDASFDLVADADVFFFLFVIRNGKYIRFVGRTIQIRFAIYVCSINAKVSNSQPFRYRNEIVEMMHRREFKSNQAHLFAFAFRCIHKIDLCWPFFVFVFFSRFFSCNDVACISWLVNACTMSGGMQAANDVRCEMNFLFFN